ncbi:basic helix-loop-helix (bHLH) DNA-bindingsuperfamily protein [Striga asiatica]|uniref:Basic helix-loop-helix (BHLH) DNA-bindingsuperfamily protein n=1 Tax=Striga asiatica TaxID=4170 RepID=A0A5A7PNV3_STRAF|nr:basic helix-loop-helix (bHLH) DNA-bindingsuperfamily protein [Striga asiatica]
MALETVIFQQDPFAYCYRDYGSYGELQAPQEPVLLMEGNIGNEDVVNVNLRTRNKRRRSKTKVMKNREEMENQRMTHIAVERNRRRQMNDYLAILRSLMPPSYAQRGDQASIVGGAINFVKELEQLLQFLEANNPANQHSNTFSDFFTFPQYSQSPDTAGERRLGIADIEVAMAESHANIKILTKKRPKQLLKLVARFKSIGLTVLHLNITTLDQSIFYSFTVKIEDECEMTTVNEIATSVHDTVLMIEGQCVV